MSKDTFKKDTVILHDTFLYRGGGERLIMYMRESLNADLATGFFDSGSYPEEDIKKNAGDEIKFVELVKSKVFTKGFRHIKLKLAFLYKTKFLSSYRNVVFSGDCLSAVRNCDPKSKKIYYCHTPPRYIFDKRDWYESQLKKHYGFLYLAVRPMYRFIREIFKKQYLNDISQMDIVITNSETVKERINKYCNIDALIIYPPVDISKFRNTSSSNGNYFLSFGRLAKLKRVDLIIKAFKKLPQSKLVITYGKNDPEKNSLFELARGCNNIEFRTDVDDQELIELISGARATIYIPKDEDFGMSPVESMSCGTPVIGVKEGGLKETILDGKTGLLLDVPEESISDEIVRVVKNMLGENISFDPSVCKNQAQRFSIESFSKEIKSYIS